MFQKVMVQITKQKKEKSIINRIIVDVFQLNKKLKTKSTTHSQTRKNNNKHTERDTKKPQQEKKENDMEIFTVKKERSSVENDSNNNNNNNKLLFVNKQTKKQLGISHLPQGVASRQIVPVL